MSSTRSTLREPQDLRPPSNRGAINTTSVYAVPPKKVNETLVSKVSKADKCTLAVINSSGEVIHKFFDIVTSTGDVNSFGSPVMKDVNGEVGFSVVVHIRVT